ncbi:hypothetical protein CPB97_009397 [Podila verticillata]|nr:hypothetical protein CPB97_009397 [Podila verticillata]
MSREYNKDLFAQRLRDNAYIHHSAQLVTLFSHSQRSESYMYFRRSMPVFGFLFEGKVNKLNVDWKELGSDLDLFQSGLRNAINSDDRKLDALWTELSRIVKPLIVQGLKGVDFFGHLKQMLHFRLEVKDGAIAGITELHVSFFLLDLRTKKHPVLQRLVMRPDGHNVVESMNMVMAKSPKVQHFDIPILEREVFKTVAILSHDWPGTRPAQVTLYEYHSENDGATLVKLQLGRKVCGKGSPATILILEWSYDLVSEILNDWSSVVLNLATKSGCASLVSLALNTTWLTKIGLDSMLQILEQSDLEFLSINCGAFGPSQASHLGQLLDAVNWYALKSLELAGDNIDGWIELWAKCGKFMKFASFEIQFVRLSIVGSGGQETQLSHASALWLHNVIYSLSPMEVCLRNIELQEARDWELIRGAIDGISS